MQTHTAESMIMKYAVKAIDSTEGGVANLISTIAPKIPCLILLVFIKKCIDNSGEIFYSVFQGTWSCFKRLFYSHLTMEVSTDANNSSYHLSKTISTKWGTFSSSLFPMYYLPQAEGTSTVTLSYFGLTHKKVVASYQ